MNNVYRVVWNAALGLFQAVSEQAHAGGAGKTARSARRRNARKRAALKLGAAAVGLSLASAIPLAYADGVGGVQGLSGSFTGGAGGNGGGGSDGDGGAGTDGGAGSDGTSPGGAGGPAPTTVSTTQSISGDIAGNAGNGGTPGTDTGGGGGGGGVGLIVSGAGVGLTNSGGTITGGAGGNGGSGVADAGGGGGGGGAGMVIGTGATVNNSGGTIAGGAGGTGGAGTSGAGAGTSGAGAGTSGAGAGNGGFGNGGGGGDGIVVNGTGVTINNEGTIAGGTGGAAGGSGGSNGSDGDGIVVNGSVDSLTNMSGASISGGLTGITNQSGATIGTLTNGGTISSSASSGVGIFNSGTITAVNNSGQINGQVDGIINNGSIGALTNSGTIDSFRNNAIINLGSIGTLTNNGGTISLGPGTGLGIVNGGTITVLNNNGGIISGNVAINNSAAEGSFPGTIGTLTNSGIINGAQTGIKNPTVGTIGTLSNSGTITGAVFAINNVAGLLGPITNSGVIAGNIANSTGNDLSISGGTGAMFGTLTGFGGGSTIGTITNTLSNVTLGSGNLLLNDNIAVGSFAVNNTGTAVLQVNQPVTITGNYNQGASATLQIGVASGAATLGAITDTGYGRLVVTGNATIASGSSVTLQSNGFAFAAGQRYVVVDTAGTAVYNPGSLDYSINGYTSSVTGSTVANGSNSDLVLNVLSATLDSTTPPPSTPPTSTPNPALIATAPNAVASLKGLLSYTGIGDPALLNLFNAALGSLSQGSAATANRIGKQLAPTQVGTAAAAPTFDTMNVVGAHVDGLRLAQADGDAGDTGVATGEGPAQWGVWGQAFGGHASQNERDQVDGYNGNYGGLLLGVDHAINDNWRAGGVFSYSNTSVNNTGDTLGDTTTINGYGLIGYASYTGSPWYVNLSGGVVQQQYDTTRAVNFQGFSGTAGSHFSGQQYVARAEAGYPLALGGLTLTPLASLTYSYQDQGSYTESGGNGAALSVGATHANSVKSALGAKLEKTFSSHYGEIVPDLQVQWIHEYDHTAQATGASFAGDPTGQTAFTTVGITPVSDLADASLGVTLLRANNLSLSVHYELQAGGGFVSQTGTVRVRQLF